MSIEIIAAFSYLFIMSDKSPLVWSNLTNKIYLHVFLLFVCFIYLYFLAAVIFLIISEKLSQYSDLLQIDLDSNVNVFLKGYFNLHVSSLASVQEFIIMQACKLLGYKTGDIYLGIHLHVCHSLL